MIGRRGIGCSAVIDRVEVAVVLRLSAANAPARRNYEHPTFSPSQG
jgi:hypothetical protein